MANTTNPHVRDVPKAFDDIRTEGDLDVLNGEPLIPNIVASHIQGVCEAHGYYFMTYNNKGYSQGRLLTVDRRDKRLLNTVDADVEGYNHPGGCQAIGDFMVVGVETSDYKKGDIWLYSLTNDPRDKGPKKLDRLVRRENKGCGGAGITDFIKDGKRHWLTVAMDSGDLDFYVSNGEELGSKGCSFEKAFNAKLRGEDEGSSSVNLVTDEGGHVYLVGFVKKDDENRAVLYKVDRAGREIHRIKDRRFHAIDGTLKGAAGVYFRWGAGLTIKSDHRLELLATQRNWVANMFAINTFKPR